WKDASNFMVPGHSINQSQPLFIKIDDDLIKIEKEKLYHSLEETKEEEIMKKLISIDDFAKMEFKIGKVISAEAVKGSSNLLKLQVDLRDKKIQVVAGLAQKYSPDDILNKQVVVLVNLEPAKLFGVKSEGMILATSESLSILSAETAEIGEIIK
ncbi:MAG: methionine--tRNA ligase subunit beta, partial [Methanobacterium sp.]|nr:methionine--tRNA ligase subunit beta [Methanobacterium sp.]